MAADDHVYYFMETSVSSDVVWCWHLCLATWASP